MQELACFSLPGHVRRHCPPLWHIIRHQPHKSASHAIEDNRPAPAPSEQRLNGSSFFSPLQQFSAFQSLKTRLKYIPIFKAGRVFSKTPAQARFTSVLWVHHPTTTAKGQVLQRRHIYCLHLTARTHPQPAILARQLAQSEAR